MNNKLKLLVASSTIFVIVCTALVLSTIPLEKYNVGPTQTTVLRGVRVKLYEPVLPVDIVRVFSKYTYLHTERSDDTVKYTYVKYCIDEVKSNKSFVSYNVSMSVWVSHNDSPGTRSNSTYSVTLEASTGSIIDIVYVDDGYSENNKSVLEAQMQSVLGKPFREQEPRDILYSLKLMSVDGFLISSSDYVKIYSKNITEYLSGRKVTGFKVYVYFPRQLSEVVSGEQGYDYDKWAGIYGVYPLNIELDIVRLPGTGKWIITYMHVELENGVVHDYFLKDIELVQ